MSSLLKGIGNSLSVRKYYDNWSSEYDQSLHQWNYKAPKQSVKILNQYIKKRTNLKLPKSQKKCLDIGCGSGRHIIYLHKNGFNVSGIDIFPLFLSNVMVSLHRR